MLGFDITVITDFSSFCVCVCVCVWGGGEINYSGEKRVRERLTNLLEPWRAGGGPMSFTLLYHMWAMMIAMTATRGARTKAMRTAMTMPAMTAAGGPSSPVLSGEREREREREYCKKMANLFSINCYYVPLVVEAG